MDCVKTFRGHCPKPRFVRFPGGSVFLVPGAQEHYWKESVGPQKDRKPAYNIWGCRRTPAGLELYEYFQWCEDMGAEPLPWRQVFLVRTLWQMSAEWLVSRADPR